MKQYRDFVDALCSILYKNRAIKNTDAQTLKHLFYQREDAVFEDFLLEEGLVSKEDLLKALGELYDVPAIDVMGIFFEDIHHLVRMFPLDEMKRNCFLPFDRDGDVLIVVASNPNNATLAEIIGRYVSYDVTFLVGLCRDIIDQVETFYDQSIEVLESELNPEVAIPEEIREKEEEKDIEDLENLD